MPRIGKSEIANRVTKTAPRLIVVNSSTSQGRAPVMLRMRPTVLARLRDMTVGPTYLIIEHALTKLMDELEALPPGTMHSLNAHEMDPSPEDWEMLDNVPSRRKKRTPREVPDATDDSAPSGARNRPVGKGGAPKN